MKRPGERHRDDGLVRKERIVDESIRLIGLRGYHAFTIGELAERCEVSKAGVLYYFGSKQLLLLAAMEKDDQRATKSIAPFAVRALSSGKNGPEAFLDLMRAILHLGIDSPEIMRMNAVLRTEALDSDHPACDAILRREASFLDVITKAVTPLVIDPASAARRILAVMDGLGEQWLRRGQNFDLAAECLSTIETILGSAARSQKRTRLRSLPSASGKT